MKNITGNEILKALDEASKKSGSDYFGDGFIAGVYFAMGQLQNEVIELKNFKIQKADPMQGLDRSNTIWVDNSEGEGTEIDIDKIFKQEL